ncbi:MAG: PBP1A family penicillin-binding protein [Acidimicrobiia bacterium]|nr:PBP1A family penicillin-binding protein [Acidimicrobiia bacterium]
MIRGNRRWISGLVALALVASACSLTVAPLEDPGIGESSLTTIVYAADGSILAHWHAGEDRTLVVYDDIPQHLIDAVVAIEDERYWDHPGVDLRAILRAAEANGAAGEIVQGGSTITQQYLKNVLLTNARTLDRKLEEAALAVRLEEGLTKEQILERYLNTIYLGDGAYGVGTAAVHYFDKDVDELTLAEASLLAALIQAPGATNPRTNAEEAITRRKIVLDKMVEQGYVTSAEAAAASLEQIVLAAPARITARARYPYFVEELKQQLLDDVRLGETPTDRYNALFQGGLRIFTTLEPAIQDAAEQAVTAVMVEDDGPDAAVVSIDPRTGYVKAIVGGRDFYDEDDPIAQFNLATQGRRQPGSSFKPFVLAAALENGTDLYDVFEAGRTVEVQTDSRIWTVENYNQSAFPPLTVLEATVYSVNVVYARLMDAVGPAQVKDLAERAGITSELQPYHALALGAQEVSPLDMASAYGSFAADGLHVEPTMFTAIETHDGAVVIENEPAITQAFEHTVADQVTTALTEVVKRGTAQRARIGRPIAGKTGTSQEHRDAWFVGYTPELSTAVWVGFAQTNDTMEEPVTPITVTGGTWPAEIWALFSLNALATVPYSQLAVAGEDGTVAVDVDLSTGYLAGPLCPHEHIHRLQLPPGDVPTVICPIHNPSDIVGIGAGQVPPVIGLELSEAVSALNRAGFEVRLDWEDGGNLPQGTIFGQTPDAGVPAQSGSIVTLILAGPEPGAVMPSVLGLTMEDARTELDLFGIPMQFIEEAESDPSDAARRAGRIWKQSPGAGSAADATVSLWVNPGGDS